MPLGTGFHVRFPDGCVLRLQPASLELHPSSQRMAPTSVLPGTSARPPASAGVPTPGLRAPAAGAHVPPVATVGVGATASPKPAGVPGQQQPRVPPLAVPPAVPPPNSAATAPATTPAAGAGLAKPNTPVVAPGVAPLTVGGGSTEASSTLKRVLAEASTSGTLDATKLAVLLRSKYCAWLCVVVVGAILMLVFGCCFFGRPSGGAGAVADSPHSKRRHDCRWQACR